jgi:hypothetical protein
LKLIVHQVSNDDIFQDIVRVHQSHRPGILAGRVFRVTANGQTVRAIARGAIDNDRRFVWIDDAMRSRLNIAEGSEVEFTFGEGSWFDQFIWVWTASDPVTRTAGRLGVFSLLLGLIGLALGLISLLNDLQQSTGTDKFQSNPQAAGIG